VNCTGALPEGLRLAGVDAGGRGLCRIRSGSWPWVRRDSLGLSAWVFREMPRWQPTGLGLIQLGECGSWYAAGGSIGLGGASPMGTVRTICALVVLLVSAACYSPGPESTWGPRDVAIERIQAGMPLKEACSARAVMASTMYMHECVERFERSLSYCPELIRSQLPASVTLHQFQYIFMQLFACRMTLRSGADEFEVESFGDWAQSHPYFSPKSQ